ncbi:NAD(P)H-dependent oxidoreductase subunit E [Saccharopolyspora sp. CA-218241]|uniref:NAD(P)H-dependent oxidoreductase subunit E n=1 Tax=Saccharopolyspora sp. CA-218241 TaxID=3240027 RepID=UPI003D96ED26
MDLHLLSSAPTAVEQAAIDDLLGPGDGNGHGPAPGRDQLLPCLHAVNDRVGWISPGALNHICRRLSVPPADAYGVASFYALFALRPRAPRVLHVCDDLACRTGGSAELVDALHRELGPPGEDRGGVTWTTSPCLGVCERAPAALSLAAGDPAEARLVAPADDAAVAALARAEEPGEEPEPVVPQAGSPGLALLRRIGVVDPESLDDYRAHGGYTALRTALRLGPAGVIREVTEANLTGRGGAAFPTGRKWEATAGQPVRPHYLICNADESEPGTFKDRVLMEGDPFAVVEAMTIAAFATGCSRGYLYLRGEYPRALRRMRGAIDRARERGLLGRDILGEPGFDFDIEIRRGAGAYICGEETAIFNSIEGYRGEPRTKPPFPVERGLFGKPTAVNNVETLLNVPLILTGGASAYAGTGTGGSTGTRLFCLSGQVRRPGVYEVPFGTTLRALLDLAGGTTGELRAVLLGGAAGGFVGPDRLDLPLSLEGAREAGTTLGSGVVLVFDETADLPDLLLRIAAFFRDESCGQCVPCRVGTVRQEEALQRLVGQRANSSGEDDLALLREVGRAMRDSSICGLGQTAWNAVESAIDSLGALSGGAPGTTTEERV